MFIDPYIPNQGTSGFTFVQATQYILSFKLFSGIFNGVDISLYV